MEQEELTYDISIILVNYNNPRLTAECIQSIRASGAKVSYEIIVIDNHSEGDSLQQLAIQFPELQVKDSGRNGGFAFGNNAGVKMAQGKYLLLQNNDTVVNPGMLDVLYEYAEEHPQVGILGCRCVDRDGLELPTAHSYETLRRIRLQNYLKPVLTKLGIQRKIVALKERGQNVQTDFYTAQWIVGSSMFIRKELYDQIGGLDENFFMYMEDEDLCHRVNDAGYIVGIIPYKGYTHYCGGSTIQSAFLTKEYIKSRLIFFKRYEPDHFYAIRKELYRQIRIVNPTISYDKVKKMQKELDDFIETELEGLAQNIKKTESMR